MSDPFSVLYWLGYFWPLWWEDLCLHWLPELKGSAGQLALKAWSMWAIYLSLAVQAADFLMPYLIDYSSPTWVKVVAFFITMVAGYVRLMPQKTLPTEDPKWHSSTMSVEEQQPPS